MEDVEEFLGAYQQALTAEMTGEDWPSQITSTFTFESCLQHRNGKEVYLVVDRRTGGLAILRVTTVESGESADAEYAILKKLDHPGIPKAYGTFTAKGRSYVVREYLRGQPLDEYTAQRTLSTDEILDITRKICDLLGYLHAQTPPVIHRDIKPQNIIILPDGSIGLTDFGIARTFKEGNEVDTHFAGTMPYAPPEQYGFAQSTPQTDIYALGVVIIYLATGNPSHKDLSARVVDKRLLAIIEKCIALDPARRYQHSGQIVHDIDHPKGNKKRFVIFGAIAFALLVLALVGIPFVRSMMEGQVAEGPSQGQVAEGSSQGQEGTGSTSSGDGDADGNSSGEYKFSQDPRRSSKSWLYDYNNGGNLSSNINNGGFAVGDSLVNHEIYVVIDKGLYALDAEGKVLRLIESGSSIKSLNYYQGKLYCVSGASIVEIDPKTSVKKVIIKTRAYDLYFDQGRLYFTDPYDGLRLYSAKIDGSSITKVSDVNTVYYRNIVNGVMYYADGDDGNFLYSQNLSSGEITEYVGINGLWLSVHNGRIYYNEATSINAAMRSMHVDGTDNRLLKDRPGTYLVATARGVFVLDSISKGIVVMDADGSNALTLVEENAGSFCVVDGWVIYKLRDGNELWMVREDGTDNHKIDTSGIE
jgi:serine/threonine protein kinase